MASVDGNLGLTSSGTIGLTVIKTVTTHISDLNDMLVNWSDGDSDLVWFNDLCAYSSRAMGAYSITATGNNANNQFILSDGHNNNLPYSVSWNDGGAGNLSASGKTLSPGVKSAAMTKAATDSSNCHGAVPGATARLIVNIPATAIKAVAAGNFTDILTVLITPN